MQSKNCYTGVCVCSVVPFDSKQYKIKYSLALKGSFLLVHFEINTNTGLYKSEYFSNLLIKSVGVFLKLRKVMLFL